MVRRNFSLVEGFKINDNISNTAAAFDEEQEQEQVTKVGKRISLLGVGLTAVGLVVDYLGQVITFQETQVTERKNQQSSEDLQAQINTMKKQMEQNAANIETSNQLLVEILKKLDQ